MTMKLAAILLVSIGGVGLIVMFALMRRRMEQLRRWQEDDD
jgi:tRNA A37 threonylcarbamoyladenosine dehydratase